MHAEPNSHFKTCHSFLCHSFNCCFHDRKKKRKQKKKYFGSHFVPKWLLCCLKVSLINRNTQWKNLERFFRFGKFLFSIFPLFFLSHCRSFLRGRGKKGLKLKSLLSSPFSMQMKAVLPAVFIYLFIFFRF